MTTHQELVEALTTIISRESAEGCPMAHPQLIEPAIRRWMSYARRNKRRSILTGNIAFMIWKRGCGRYSLTIITMRRACGI